MRLPNTAHTARPWRIHELTRDFRARGRVGASDPGRPGRLPPSRGRGCLGRPLVAELLPRHPRPLGNPLGVTHIGWVSDGAGGYRGQMAVLVKPNGLFGTAYVAAIKPFRHLFVYPPMIRRIGREWRDREY